MPPSELERIQFQMAQKPVLRGEVGARALRVRCACVARAVGVGWVGVGAKLAVHDALGGYLVCGGLSFYPHAQPGTEPGIFLVKWQHVLVQHAEKTNCH